MPTSAGHLDTVSLSKATFGGNVDFGGAMFSNQVDFEAAEFNSRTVFADAKFEISVPDFRDAKLREATEWHGASPKNNEAIQQHIYAYERLKAEMERLKKHEEEQFFFAKELRARRAREPRWLKRLPNYAYEILSAGASRGRPFGFSFCGLSAPPY